MQYCNLYKSDGFEKILKTIQQQWDTDLGFSSKQYNIQVGQQLLKEAYRLITKNALIEAEKKIDDFGGNNSHTPHYWYWKARVALARQNLEVVMSYLDKAIKVSPHHPQSLALKIKYMLLQGGANKNKAKVMVESSLGLSSDLDHWLNSLLEQNIFEEYLTTESEFDKKCPIPLYSWESDIA